MATLKLIKSKHGFKIIINSPRLHPALLAIGRLLKEHNKHNEPKISCYAVYGGEFSLNKTVFSYISGKSEKMNKRNYNKWLKGERQITIKKEVWKSEELDLGKLLEDAI
jgi:hypothetical protein